MAIFGPKPWVNPFDKMSIFRLFELSVFIVQKGVFWFQNIVKDIFPKKKMLEKWPFLEQNHGLTPLEKCQFLDFLKMSIFRLFKLLFLQARKVFLVLEYRKTHFPGLYCLKKKVGIMAIYGTKPWVNPFEKMSIFQLFEL